MQIPVFIAIIVAFLLIIFLTVVLPKFRNSDSLSDVDVSDRIQKKGRNAIIKDAQKKLRHDPRNVSALEMLGDLYFEEKDWDKVWSTYKSLYDISTSHIEVNIARVTLRLGIAAFYQGKLEDALNYLLVAMKREPDSFEANLYVAKTCYEQKIYDKAFICLKKARMINPENREVIRMIGLCLFNLHKYREALPFLKRSLEEMPDNKEIVYDVAVSMSECSMEDKALKIFMHLRPDPVYGPSACLEAGKMHERMKDYKAAIQDYAIAMKLPDLPEQTSVQIKYRCAADFIALNDIPKALTLLKQIQLKKPGYKDVDQLVTRYSELNQNKNLQIYLMSGTSEFVALVRKLITNFHSDSYCKIEDIQVYSECVEAICTVENPKWEAKEIFRFYRNQTVVGDINIRDFHEKVRETKSDKGICVTVSSFSESAHRFVEGRPIDLIEKEQLCKMLKKITNGNL